MEGVSNRMKKDKRDIVVVALVFSLLFTGCSTPVSGNIEITDEPEVTSIAEDKYSDITKEALKKYIKENEEYQDVLCDVKENEIQIEEKVFHEKKYHFFLYTPEEQWSTTLYFIHEENGAILGLDYITEGAVDYFNYELMSMSQGVFITAYSAGYMGNGNLVFIDMEKMEGRKRGAIPDYEFYAIDSHYEQMQFNHSPVVSSIFENGVLVPEYIDENQDGHTDILLKGIRVEYEYDEETDMQNLKQRTEVCQFYQYEPETQSFILESGEDLREKRQVSLCDSVINNHELLNDTMCSDYRVQDILQYHGEPKKTIHNKDGEGQYHHYLVYDGIIYVLLGEKVIETTQYIDYVIITNDIFSLSIGIQVGMDEKELADTGLYFEKFEDCDDLDSELLSGKAGYLKKMKIKYDAIYYAEGTFEENIALAVIVRNGKVVRIATDKLY